MKIRKNKRGVEALPTLILVLGVLAICGLAILTFFLSMWKTEKAEIIGTNLFERIYSDVEKFHLYVAMGFSPEDAASKITDTSQAIKIDAHIEKNKILVIKGSSFSGVKDTLLVEYRKKF